MVLIKFNNFLQEIEAVRKINLLIQIDCRIVTLNFYQVLAVQVIPYGTENATKNTHIWCVFHQSFCTNQGLSQHQGTCQTRSNTHTNSRNTQEVLNVEASSQNSAAIEDNLTISCAKYTCRRYEDYDFEKDLSTFYEKIVLWKKNLFLLPSGKTERKFTEDVSRLMEEWLQDSLLKDTGFEAIMVMPNLLLQKPSQK